MGKGFLTGRFDKNSTFDGFDFRSIVPRFEQKHLEANQVLATALSNIEVSGDRYPAELAKRVGK